MSVIGSPLQLSPFLLNPNVFCNGRAPQAWAHTVGAGNGFELSLSFPAVMSVLLLVFLSWKVKEPDFEHLVKTGKHRNLPPRFMSVNQCLRQMMEVEEEKKGGAYSWDTRVSSTG